LHWGVGNAAEIIAGEFCSLRFCCLENVSQINQFLLVIILCVFFFAVISIFFGIKQQSLLLPYPWTTGVLSAFVVWTIVLKLVLKLHKHDVIRKGLYKSFLH